MKTIEEINKTQDEATRFKSVCEIVNTKGFDAISDQDLDEMSRILNGILNSSASLDIWKTKFGAEFDLRNRRATKLANEESMRTNTQILFLNKEMRDANVDSAATARKSMWISIAATVVSVAALISAIVTSNASKVVHEGAPSCTHNQAGSSTPAVSENKGH